MKALRWLVVAGVLAGAWTTARAEPGAAPDLVEVGVDVSAGSGASEWEIIFFQDFLGEGRSILDWKDLEAETRGLHGIVNIGRWVSVAAAYAEGDIKGGQATDTDTISDALLGLDNFVFSESEADTDGELTALQGDLRFNLDALPGIGDWPGRLYVLLGYQAYEENLRDRNGVQTVVDEEPYADPIEGLDNTFDFTWNAVRVGAGGSVDLADTLALRAQAAALVNVEYEGEGYWNLREDFRATPPSFIQRGDHGTGADLRISLAWRPLAHLLLEIGVWHMRWQVDEGFDRTFFADGTSADSILVRAESERTGGFVSGSVVF